MRQEGEADALIGSDTDSDRDEGVSWSFDKAMEEVGVGCYQIFIWTLLILVAASCAFNNMAIVFEGGSTDYLCATPPDQNNVSKTVQAHHYHPDKCSYNQTTYYRNGTNTTNSLTCSTWVYNTTVYNTSIISQWDLTCDRETLVSLSGTIYMLGFFSGCLIMGHLSDRYGRRLLMLIAVILTLAAGLTCSLSQSIVVYSVSKFFVGFGVAGTRNCAYILVTELAAPALRGTMGILTEVCYSSAYILTGFIFYLDPNWRRFQFYISIYHIFYLLYVFVIPESPRWLLTNGKTEDCMEYFRRSARYNKVKLPPKLSIKLTGVTQSKGSVLDLLSTGNLRVLGLVLNSLWFFVSLIYFGMSYNVSNLQGSVVVNNAILGAVELLGNISGIFIIKIGRRPAIFFSFVVAAGSMAILIFIHSSYWGTLVLAMLGKFVIAPCFSYIYVSTAELYPTQSRNLALGLGSSLARLGGALGPFIKQSFDVWKELPYIIFTAVAGLATLISILLPETKNRVLPDSIQDASEMNALNKKICWCKKRSAAVMIIHDDDP